MPLPKFSNKVMNFWVLICIVSYFNLKYSKMRVIGKALRGDDIFFSFLLKLIFIFFCTVFMVSDFSGNSPSDMKSKSSQDKPFILNEMSSMVEAHLQVKRSIVKVEKAVQKGDTIIDILKKAGIDYRRAYQLFSDMKNLYDLRNIRPGQKYSLVFEGEDLKKFHYEINSDRCLKVYWGKDNQFVGRIEKISYIVKRKIIHGKVSSSLFLTILGLGEGPELADRLASLYEYDIDFNRDIRQGDTFTVLVEKRYQGSEFNHYGPILAARFSNRDRIIHVLRYTDPQGKTAYYHPDGRAVQKMFLRCPLPFMRVTSRYGNRRHPVLGFSARHNGVDLAAPPGTLIRSTSSGVVFKTGYDRIKGRYVIIRHPNRYATHYYHLNRIKTGIKPGVSVIQGQIIGYVGRTGRVTGWHLHYGIRKNGRFINPLNLKSPSKNPVKEAFRQNFEQYGAAMLFLLSGSRILGIPARLQEILLRAVGHHMVHSGGMAIH